jgi:hypothetical protein
MLGTIFRSPALRKNVRSSVSSKKDMVDAFGKEFLFVSHTLFFF